MGILRRKVPANYLPIHPANIASKDWVILLEAGTIVGSPNEKLRVAKATTERKIKKKYNIFLQRQCFLVLDEYDPRIHALYFCPQLYRRDVDGKLIPLEGLEIGELLVQQLQKGVVQRSPWYEPADTLPAEPAISGNLDTNFETMVVEIPKRNAAA
jgi:hypothetical protein